MDNLVKHLNVAAFTTKGPIQIIRDTLYDPLSPECHVLFEDPLQSL